MRDFTRLPGPPSQRGFTLIELMIAFLIAGIVLAIGIPSFTQIFATQRTKTAAKTMYSALNQARSEAIRLNGICDIYLVPQTAADWANGVRIIAVTSGGAAPAYTSTAACASDADGDGTNDFNFNNPLAEFGGQNRVLGTPGPNAGDTRANLRYNRMGRLSGGGTAEFHFCDDDNLAADRWTVSLDVAGLPRYSSDGDCPLT